MGRNVVSTERGTGALGQTRPFLPGVFPQSLYSIDDVRDGDDEHVVDDGRTAMAMAMAMAAVGNAKGEKRMSIRTGSNRVGRKINLVVRGAHETNKSPRQLTPSTWSGPIRMCSCVIVSEGEMERRQHPNGSTSTTAKIIDNEPSFL
jgi:hypothetical protein